MTGWRVVRRGVVEPVDVRVHETHGWAISRAVVGNSTLDSEGPTAVRAVLYLAAMVHDTEAVLAPGVLTTAEATAAERERCAKEIEGVIDTLNEYAVKITGKPLDINSRTSDSAVWLAVAAQRVRAGGGK